jgi:hypothetical protein
MAYPNRPTRRGRALVLVLLPPEDWAQYLIENETMGTLATSTPPSIIFSGMTPSTNSVH